MYCAVVEALAWVLLTLLLEEVRSRSVFQLLLAFFTVFHWSHCGFVILRFRGQDPTRTSFNLGLEILLNEERTVKWNAQLAC